jgi:hypothetical protein
MTRNVGIDSLSPLSQSLIDSAVKAMGQPLRFAGRYFTSAQTKGTGEYHHATEGPIAAANGLRILPFARQTNHVGGAHTYGFQDGVANGDDLIKSFGGLTKVRIFLDVEGQGLSHLSAEYYRGWCDGLRDVSGDVELIPCVYGIPGDAKTWAALRAALAAGATCGGVCLSHPFAESYVDASEPIPWTPHMLSPYQPIDGVDVLLWQYAFGDEHHAFDRQMVNPAIDLDELLSTLPNPGAK